MTMSKLSSKQQQSQKSEQLQIQPSALSSLVQTFRPPEMPTEKSGNSAVVGNSMQTSPSKTGPNNVTFKHPIDSSVFYTKNETIVSTNTIQKIGTTYQIDKILNWAHCIIFFM